MREVAGLFGFKRMTQNTGNRMDVFLDWALEQGAIVEEEGRLSLP